ncbi:MAG: hypothetical protein HY298_20100, partial [Verrucomicrobia bacterium]|nr:hypothetical protein [Verrucomicrobiota bacterium]
MNKTYSAKEPPPPPEERVFPLEVRQKRGASVVIYEGQNRGEKIYTIAYPCDGQRRRRMRRNFEEAFACAKEIVLKMSDGALNVLTLDGRERFVYERAVELAAPTGIELDALVSRAVEASKIAGGPDHLIEAARSYEARRRGVEYKMLSDVVAVNDLLSNWASMVMAALAWNLKSWYGLLTPNRQRGLELVRMEFRRFLQAILLIPCQVVRTARRV